MLKKSLTAVTMVFALVGYVHADDGGGDGGQLEYVSYQPTIDQVTGTAMSCEEARATAWFERELQKTDGNVEPDLKYVPCGREILAKSTADAD
jgi:hypothetical protein